MGVRVKKKKKMVVADIIISATVPHAKNINTTVAKIIKNSALSNNLKHVNIDKIIFKTNSTFIKEYEEDVPDRDIEVRSVMTLVRDKLKSARCKHKIRIHKNMVHITHQNNNYATHYITFYKNNEVECRAGYGFPQNQITISLAEPDSIDKICNWIINI